ncbi:MAG: hypothetical protein ABII82_04215 [Verrucomicrobiota bacterium]
MSTIPPPAMNPPRSYSSRGSVILVVVISTTILLVIAASLLAYGLTERKINRLTQLRFQAKNAAEGILEYAASEVSNRLNNNFNFSSTEFETSPTLVHTTRASVLYASGAGEYNYVTPASSSLHASLISSATKRYIDPLNPANDYDPLRGQWVTSRTVRFLSAATATDGNGRSSTSHGTQSIEIRDAALFNYAIFYNLTMEFHPSPSMTIAGPVHSNKDSYLTEQNTLSFLGTYTTAGKLSVGAYTSGRPSGRRISFTTGIDDNNDGTNDLVTANNPTINGSSVGTYIDSNIQNRDSDLNFRDLASQIWNGYVQDSSHGVTEQSPPGVITGAQAHDLIEAPDFGAGADASIESQKFSNKAGLYVVVDADGDTHLFTSPEDAGSYKTGGSAWLAANPDKVVIPPSGMVQSNRRLYDHREGRWVNIVDVDVGALREAINETDTNGDGDVDVLQTKTVTTTTTTETYVDRRGRTRTREVTETVETFNDIDIDDTWNGLVYVDVVAPSSGYSATSDIGGMGTGSGSRTAVRLLNGTKIPDRSAVDPADSSLPEGLTLATNAPVYVAGNFNADGNLNTGSMTQPEGGDEAPAAIVADAINVLSNAWIDGSGKPAGDATSSSTSRPNAAHTEVSAAFLTGIVSSSSNNNSDYSGGVENYPRFHENWGGRSLRYRGSIVALFESEIARGKWSAAKYGAPNREWGFNSMFGNGQYPPGTPIVRTYRRLDYRDITKPEYDTLLANADLDFTPMVAPAAP